METEANEGTPSDSPATMVEELDNLTRSNKKVKTHAGDNGGTENSMDDNNSTRSDDRRKSTCLDKVLGKNFDTEMDEVNEDQYDGEVSDDDAIEEEEDGPWFSMGMSREKKLKTRKPRKWSLIIKLVGRGVGYQFLYR